MSLDQKQKYVLKYYFVRGKSASDGRHKAGRAAFGLSCVARFEQLACVLTPLKKRLISNITEN
jgi:hypothetical protein